MIIYTIALIYFVLSKFQTTQPSTQAFLLASHSVFVAFLLIGFILLLDLCKSRGHDSTAID